MTRSAEPPIAPPLKVVVFPITYRCNARCIMCSIGGMKWNDRPVSFFERFFASPATDTLESINITGGEPTLRTDLPALVAMVARNSPQLREVLINSNGLRPQHVVNRIRETAESLPPDIKVWAFISLDAMDKSASVTRGFENASALARQSIEGLKRIDRPNFKVGISCTITKENYRALPEVHAYAKEQGLYADFPYATVNSTYINSAPKADQFVTTAEQDVEIGRFYAGLAAEPLSAATSLYYGRMQEYLTTGRLNHGDCVFRSGYGVLLEPDGKVRVCGMSDDSLVGDIASDPIEDILARARPNMWKHCNTCTTNSYASWTPDAQRLAKQDMLAKVRERRGLRVAG